jgi:hypothetical protein
MNIHEALLAEHSKRQTAAIVKFIGDNPVRFAELMTAFFDGPYRVTQRASWPMGNCVELHPELIDPHLARLLRELDRDNLHNAVRRNILRLLQFVDLPKRFYGRVFSRCIEFLDDPKEMIAVRVFAMTVAAQIAKSEPDLMKEVCLVAGKYVDDGSPGFRARARMVLPI